jgi:hypothetical protein
MQVNSVLTELPYAKLRIVTVKIALGIHLQLVEMTGTCTSLREPQPNASAISIHAVKGFTDSLRLELEAEGVPISVTLIKPAAIDTMFIEHAKNHMEVEPKLPAPIYAPEIAADAILYAAENFKRDNFVGGAAKLVSSRAHHAPRILDSFMKRFMFKRQKTDMPARDRSQHSVYCIHRAAICRSGRGIAATSMTSSIYTEASIHPKMAFALLLGAGLALVALWRYRQSLTD